MSDLNAANFLNSTDAQAHRRLSPGARAIKVRSVLLSSSCLAAVGWASGDTAFADSQAPRWQTWLEAGGQAGDEAAAFLEGFVPLGQDEESLVFLDLRLTTEDRGTGYSSLGIGARRIVAPDLAIGANAFIDGIRTDNDNLYAGLGIGLEAFTSRFDLRVNGYIPLGGEEQFGSGTSQGGVSVVGNSLVETTVLDDRVEAPLYGIGAELGALLDSPFSDDQFRAYAGAYHFDRDGFEHQSGARLGLEYRLENPFGLEGARFTFGAEAVYNQDDEVDGLATARLRIPLFGGSDGEAHDAPALSALQERLDESVRREAIVRTGETTQATGTFTTPVVNPVTGNAYGHVHFTDGNDSAGAGTQVDPTDLADAITDAGQNGIVVALGGNGTIDLTSGVMLLQGQTLVGGGGSIPVQLASGNVTTFNFGATNAVIDGAAGIDTITLADNVTISDLTIQGGAQAIAGANVSDFTLRDLNVENTSGDGIHVTGASNATIVGIDFAGIGGTNLFLNNHAATISDITIDGGTNGIVINNNSGTTTLSNISISNVTGDGLGFSNNTGAVDASGVSVANVGDDGIDIDGGGAFSFSGTTNIDGLGANTASDGIDLTGTSGATVSFGTVNISGVADGAGLNLSSGFDATVTAGTVNISGSGTSSGTGVDLSGSSSTASVTIGTGNTSDLQTGVVLGINGSAGVAGEADLTWSSGTIDAATALDGEGVMDGQGDYDFSSTTIDTFNFATFAGTFFVSSIGTGDGTSIAEAASLGDAITFANTNMGGATIVLINDGVYSTTMTLTLANDDITLASFGNGATYATNGLIIADTIQGDDIPDGGERVGDNRGAATLVNTADDTVQVNGDNVAIANINLGNDAAGSYAISAANIANLTISGVGIGQGATNSEGGVELNGVTGTVQASDVDIEGGNALSINGGNATITFDADSTIANDDGFAVSISGRVGGSFSHFGDISSDRATAGGISVSGAMAASNVTFGGSVALGTNTALGGGGGVTIDNNGQASTVAFNGGLDVATNGQTGFSASGGGSIAVASGSVSSANGTALDLDGVDIASGGIDFSSIGVTGTAPGAGVSLNSIGGAGTFSGGDVTIAGTSAGGAGIAVSNSTASIGFGSVDISGADGDGISLTGNSGTVDFGTTNIALGGTANTAGIDIEGTNGQVTFGDTTITGVGAGQTGVDFTGADAPATFGVTSIMGTDGTGIDLSSTQNNRSIGFATGSAITLSGASAIGVELASDNTAATAASANFTFGDGSGVDVNGTNSAIDVASGITVDTIGVQTVQGTYNFEDVAFTGNAAFQPSDLQFVHAGIGTGDGSLLNPFTVAQALAATDTDQTFVFLDGSYDFGGTTFTLDDGQSVTGFDNGASVTVAGAPINISGLGSSTIDISRTEGNTGGTSVSISNSGGADVFSFLGAGMIADLTIDGTGAGDAFTVGATNGTIMVDGVTVQNVTSGQAAFSFNGFNGTATVQNSGIASAGGGIASVTGGTGSYSFNGVTTSGTGVAGNTGILLDSLGAASAFNFSSDLTLAGYDSGISIQDIAGANVDIDFGAVDVSSSTTGISVTNITNAATGIDIDFASVAVNGVDTGIAVDGFNAAGQAISIAGTTTITEAAVAGIAISNSGGDVSFDGRTTITNTVAAGHGIDLGLDAGGANAGTYTFNGVDVTVNGTGAFGLRARNSGTVDILDPNGDNQITSNNGTAIFINPTLVDITLANVTSQNATGSGLDLELVSGSSFSVTGTADVTGSDGAGVEITNSGGSTISFGTLNIDNDDTAADGAGFVVNNSTAGAVTVNVADGTISSGDDRAINIANSGGGIVLGQAFSSVSANGADRGVSLEDTSGGGTISGTLNTGSAGTIQNTTVAAVDIMGGNATISIGQDIVTSTGRVADLGTLALGSTVNISGNINATGGTGISADQLGGATVTFSGASKVLNTGTNTAVSLTNSSAATFNFTGGGLDIDTTSGSGFLTNNAGTVTVSGANNTITSGTGGALNLSTTTIGDAGFNLASVDSTGAAQGILIDALSQTSLSTGLDIAGGAIIGATARGVDINNASADIAIGTTISTSGTARSVEVTNSGATGGNAITFSGAVTDTGAGINLDNNDQNGGDATVQFSGGLNLNTGGNTALNVMNGGIAEISGTTNSITTTSGIGINATGGGTITATGMNSSVSTTTGTGVNIDNSTIGADGFALRSVSVNGAANGIVLNNTGNTGGVFRVTGDGSLARNASGGTIQNTTGDGVELTDAFNVVLQSLDILNAGNSANSAAIAAVTNDHAVQSVRGGNITLSGVTILNPIGTGWEAFDITGVNRIDNNSLVQGLDDTSNFAGIRLTNVNTDFTSFTLDNITVDHADPTPGDAAVNGNANVVFTTEGTVNGTFDIRNSTFTGARGTAVTVGIGNTSGSTGTVDVNIVGNTFQDAHDINGQNNLAITVQQSATANVLIDGNTFTDTGKGGSLSGQIIVQQNNSAVLDTIIQDNVVNGLDTPGTSRQRGIEVLALEQSTVGGKVDAQILNNQIYDIGRTGIYISPRGAISDFDAVVRGNTVGDATRPVGYEALFENAGIAVVTNDSASSTSNSNILIENNNVTVNLSDSTRTGGISAILDPFSSGAGTVNLTVLNNTVTNQGSVGHNFFFLARDSSVGGNSATLNLDVRGNNALGATNSYRFEEASGLTPSDLNVVDFANIAANNQSGGSTANVSSVGTVDDIAGPLPQPAFN
ncbi:inverse autotransporter beta domain-containing protein [Rhizobiales bacterium]|uniref:inverse autotransporter beta domain-containing protein n=1 Tax=Hongsoonwoonella zoysiae TaxID=2821844 RepID=UPI00155FEF69|nr:inverse autotransporter beta domain-containing protein [Hongsoonwoonella zoysiae]NRG16247.1 inverse autotransporter beta domain-containing protein [Hongsoonwoonella zoysiae]